MYRHILVATDGSELSMQAVTHAVALAKALNANLTAVTVSEPFRVLAVDPILLTDTPESYRARAAAFAAEYLAEVEDKAVASGMRCNSVHVEEEQPYRAIIDTATNKGCDLIVMASHGRRGVSALLLGSETVKVLTHTSIPVLVCRSPPA